MNIFTLGHASKYFCDDRELKTTQSCSWPCTRNPQSGTGYLCIERMLIRILSYRQTPHGETGVLEAELIVYNYLYS